MERVEKDVKSLRRRIGKLETILYAVIEILEVTEMQIRGDYLMVDLRNLLKGKSNGRY